MQAKMRRNLRGPFQAQDLHDGAWRLSRTDLKLDVFLRGVDSRAGDTLRLCAISDIDIEWREAAVDLWLISASRRHSIQAQSAVVHEPLERLYDALPLAKFDAKAQHFWRRVFRLVRIPGGRFLLGVLARRSRGRH